MPGTEALPEGKLLKADYCLEELGSQPPQTGLQSGKRFMSFC